MSLLIINWFICPLEVSIRHQLDGDTLWDWTSAENMGLIVPELGLQGADSTQQHLICQSQLVILNFLARYHSSHKKSKKWLLTSRNFLFIYLDEKNIDGNTRKLIIYQMVKCVV